MSKWFFVCYFCHTVYSFYPGTDPTSSTGCCKLCGSDNWKIFEDSTFQRAIVG